VAEQPKKPWVRNRKKELDSGAVIDVKWLARDLREKK
jgi:hypothetical protein